MVIAEPTSSAEVAEIDLKCAEKVTDSDVEESNLDSEDTQKAKVPKSQIFVAVQHRIH